MSSDPDFSWQGPHDHCFKIRGLSYEFPQILDGYDANWLTLNIEARNDQGHWERKNPCILTWELVWLRRWLVAVVDGSMESEALSFLEPDLRFTFVASTRGQYHFSVVLSWGLSRTCDDRPSIIHLAVSDSAYNAALLSLDKAIERFPARGETAQINVRLGPKMIDGAGAA
ncbi:MAG: hypothetical protein AAFX44_01920 [Pseudomonadota bacterium]